MISVFKKILIEILQEVNIPSWLVSVDNAGNLTKTAASNFGVGTGSVPRNIEGGAAETVYLATQNIDGGSAATSGPIIISGGNA